MNLLKQLPYTTAQEHVLFRQYSKCLPYVQSSSVISMERTLHQQAKHNHIYIDIHVEYEICFALTIFLLIEILASVLKCRVTSRSIEIHWLIKLLETM
jgi:hypothetical protein